MLDFNRGYQIWTGCNIDIISYGVYSCTVGRFGSRGTYVINCLIILLNSTIPYVTGTLGGPEWMFQSKRLKVN